MSNESIEEREEISPIGDGDESVNSNTQNPGSALGEAIGASIEEALFKYIGPLVDQYQARLITRGPLNPQTNRHTKLLLSDEFGTRYNIDGVITNESNQPLILLESKYIRYTKHNRDKASWICHAHGELRRCYSSVRSSIAVLAGNWSRTSLTMLTSHDVNVFVVPFGNLVAILAKRGVDLNRGEKDRHLVIVAWTRYSELSDAEKELIGEEVIESIKGPLAELLASVLQDDVVRTIARVAIAIHSNLGEVKRFEFPNREAAIQFLEDFSMEEMLDHGESFTIFDIPNIRNDSEDEPA